MIGNTSFQIRYFIPPEKEGQYFTIPFEMPENSESLTIRYQYERHQEQKGAYGHEHFTAREEVTIIDLGLIDPYGLQVGASGSDKQEIFISEVSATPGYRPTPLTAGTWQILVGAYKVKPGGAQVFYEVRVAEKSLRLLKGDLHTHTLASDGVHTAAELAAKALRHGLDFLAITDHNQAASASELPRGTGVTLIPGVEWTHYRGHANFLGVDQPYDGSFAANTEEEVRSRFISARERGAMITLNHPYEENYGFLFDITTLPFDCLEVWNGPMRESNLRALGLWQSLLMAGKKIPICGGSDYHRDTPFLFLGGPATCVYSLSNGPGDILAALRAGHSYITFVPNGPSLSFNCGEAIVGDTVPWTNGQTVHILADGLIGGDSIRLITPRGTETLFEAPAAGKFETDYPITAPGFVRIEVWRSFLPGVPQLPALLSNPIYFE